MELSPQAVAAATFKTVKRGYDPDEVRAYLVEVSASLEASHQQATAMEARARAAIAKLQDASQHPAPTQAPTAAPVASADEAETISRTLLLAQRTADATVAEAKAEAERIVAAARNEAEQLRSVADGEATARTSAAVEQADRLLREAQAEAERTTTEARSEAERALVAAQEEAERAKSEAHLRAEADVARLEQQRASLLTDVDVLEHHVGEHRERLLATSAALADLAERVPGGLGDLARPELLATVEPTVVPDAPSAPPPTLPTRSLSSGNGAVPPGVEPLVSPRPTSIDEVRSTWAQAEQADLIDATPTPSSGMRLPVLEPTPSDGIARTYEPTPSGGVARTYEPTPSGGMPAPAFDATPAEGVDASGGEADATPPAGNELDG
jgi:DivIVA domain-containing protein